MTALLTIIGIVIVFLIIGNWAASIILYLKLKERFDRAEAFEEKYRIDKALEKEEERRSYMRQRMDEADKRFDDKERHKRHEFDTTTTDFYNGVGKK